ncbi:Fe-S cluster assembly protein SufD [Salinimonas sp. HHU 13199]|uniref:Fe-S cluster assembly protein SufD n=1 Tax=Salinimonas profundi TaxID=2729140 RepID=A0ABR8LNR3_9ALTE|nr:Fe-S cluster assembly protein SufD [Salinimonas profundi]MBD3586686.1 Fe-S cluster assembly protein SufD [Salinimonas profundi]
MSQWLNEVIESASATSDFLAPVRKQSLRSLGQMGWPGRRNEAWRFTPLTSLDKRQVKHSQSATSAEVPVIEGLDALELVFVDGKLTTDIETLAAPEGVSVSSFANLDDKQQQVASDLFGQIKPHHHVFGLVNDIASEQGIFIDVAEGVTVDKVIRITNTVTQDVDAHTRILVRIGKGASAKIFEDGQGAQASMSTAFSEFAIEDNAHLEHYRFAMMTGEAMQVGGTHFRLGNESTLNSTVVGYGSELSRLDVDIIHAGEHANAKMNAVYLLAEGELFDLHSNIEHAVPNGVTEENARGIIGDRARAVFNGRIHIHRDAQNTLAELNNRNLLLSRRGIINTKPELEIYADDVKCAHGATVAEIDDEALFYLLTRGVERSKALVMLNFGFIQELVNQMPDAAIREWLLPKLSERFAHMEVK